MYFFLHVCEYSYQVNNNIILCYMKILIISHYLNFNINSKPPGNVFPKMLLAAIRSSGMSYEICKFRKKEIYAAIRRGCAFILNFEEMKTNTAQLFLGDTKPGALDRCMKELGQLEKKIPMYPSTKLLNLVVSKTYLELLPNKTKLFMPSTRTFLYYKTTIDDSLDTVCNYFNRKNIDNIVVKFGYSGDTKHVFRHSISALSIPEYRINLKNEMSKYSIICGRPFLIIVQPFNAIINNRLNEYRCLFINGQISPIAAFGFSLCPKNKTQIHIPSNELDPESNEDHAEIVSLAKYGYEMFSKYMDCSPRELRVDVSWVIEDGVKRYYINEFEGLSGTYYFNLPYIPKQYGPHKLIDKYDCTPELCSNYPLEPQLHLAETLMQYIITQTCLHKSNINIKTCLQPIL